MEINDFRGFQKAIHLGKAIKVGSIVHQNIILVISRCFPLWDQPVAPLNFEKPELSSNSNQQLHLIS